MQRRLQSASAGSLGISVTGSNNIGKLTSATSQSALALQLLVDLNATSPALSDIASAVAEAVGKPVSALTLTPPASVTVMNGAYLAMPTASVVAEAAGSSAAAGAPSLSAGAAVGVAIGALVGVAALLGLVRYTATSSKRRRITSRPQSEWVRALPASDVGEVVETLARSKQAHTARGVAEPVPVLALVHGGERAKRVQRSARPGAGAGVQREFSPVAVTSV